MNVSNLKKPDFPRIISRYEYYLRHTNLKDKEPVLVRDIKKVRVSKGTDNNKKIIFPELFTDRWRPFFIDGDMLVSSVPNMLGSVVDKRLLELEAGWMKWLDKWVKLNKLGVKVDEVGVKVDEVRKEKKKDRKEKIEKTKDIKVEDAQVEGVENGFGQEESVIISV